MLHAACCRIPTDLRVLRLGLLVDLPPYVQQALLEEALQLGAAVQCGGILLPRGAKLPLLPLEQPLQPLDLVHTRGLG